MRRSAVHTCQTALFPHLESIPPQHYYPNEDFTRSRSWLKTHQPDAVIDFNETFFRAHLVDDPHPFALATLNCSETKVSGVVSSKVVAARESVILNSCRRSYQWGIPKHRIDHVVEPTWHAGETMPRRSGRGATRKAG